ncbi:MAG: hypothetical protein WC346_04330 [Methanogenium sp.]|jgi:HD superfamily phosphohydrolase
MSQKDENLEVSPEEQKAEEEAQQEVKDEELKEALAKEFELDPETDEEFLEKLFEREKAQREKLSGAIKQKINWREKAQAKKTSEEPEDSPGKGKKPDEDGEPDLDKLVDQKLSERLEARELETLELTDELKEEVKELAKLKGISVREAAKLPYILSRKEEVEREERLKKATPKRSKRGSFVPSYDPAKPLNPDDFDFDTKEGVEAWQEAKKARAKYKAQ